MMLSEDLREMVDNLPTVVEDFRKELLETLEHNHKTRGKNWRGRNKQAAILCTFNQLNLLCAMYFECKNAEVVGDDLIEVRCAIEREFVLIMQSFAKITRSGKYYSRNSRGVFDTPQISLVSEAWYRVMGHGKPHPMLEWIDGPLVKMTQKALTGPKIEFAFRCVATNVATRTGR